jgi:inner membrane protein
MPTIFTHAIFATSLGKAFASEPLPMRFWLLTAVCAMLPDVDVIGFVIGVNYGSMFGHRGITHSIAFALLVGLAVSVWGFRNTKLGLSSGVVFFYFALVTFSHPLLDALTNGGLGVALFAPFDATRFFFPWRPIAASPLGAGFFSSRGLTVLITEAEWVWLPSLLIVVIAWALKRFRGSANAA